MTDIVPLIPQLTHTPAITKAIDTITGLIKQVKSANDLYSKRDMQDRAPEIDYRVYYEKKLPADMLYISIPFNVLNISNVELEIVSRHFEIRSGIIFSIKHLKAKLIYEHCIGFKLDVLYPAPVEIVPTVKEDIKPAKKSK
jgi:hypothetical protein